MSDLREYKCPCCGGAIEFDSASQNMKCPYCDTEFDIATLDSFASELNQDTGDNMNWATTGGTGWYQGEEETLLRYVCNSCGGEVVGDPTTAATECPFCGNPVMMPGQLSGSLRPDLVIPFKLDKEAAKAALRNHYKGKVLLPKAFKDENHINEIKGIYVPFWLYDTEAHANVRYKASRTRSWSDSRYIYTETSFFAVRRGGWMGFERVPVDGSSKMDDDLMESVEPYHYSDVVDFKTAYLSGYLADKYDVTAEQSEARANERITNSLVQSLKDTTDGFQNVTVDSKRISLESGKAQYALYPVWLLNTTWNDQKFTFAMNGQTGKFVGNLPMDKGKFWTMALSLGVGLSVVATIVMMLIG